MFHVWDGRLGDAGVSRERAEFNAMAQGRKGRKGLKMGNGGGDFLTVIPAKAGIHSVERLHS